MSGGLDSSACAHFLGRQGIEVLGVYIDYGQAAARLEERAVEAVAGLLGIPVAKYRILGSGPFSSGELKGRNAFLTFAALFLTRGRPGVLAMGLHAGTPYYDCSESFVTAIAKLVAEHTDNQVSFVAPFLTWSKVQVFEYFVSAGLPSGVTYSCEAGAEPPCGACTSCRDRKALGC